MNTQETACNTLAARDRIRRLAALRGNGNGLESKDSADGSGRSDLK